MRRWGFYLLFIFFMLFGGSQAAKAQVTGELSTIESAAAVSWSEMLQQQALRPYSAEDQEHRVIPFMPAPPEKEIGAPQEGYIPPFFTQSPAETAPSPAFPSFELGSNFQALPDNNTAIPPDTMGAAGPNHLMTMLNSQVRIQNKSGNAVSTVSSKIFWSLVSSSPFDPITIYDSLSGRWIVISGSDGGSANSKILFAISQTGDPTGTWNFYSIPADTSGINWADYPRVGINSKWIAITVNMFSVSGSNFVGSKMWVLDKSTAIAGGPVTYTEFPTGFDDTGSGGGLTLTPAVTFDSGEPNLYIADNGWSSSGKQLIRLSEITGTASSLVWSVVPDSNGPFSGSGLFYAVNNYNGAQIKATQNGTTNLIDTNDPRILNAVFRNGVLWFVHTGGLPTTAAADRTAIFWYQVAPALFDSTGDPILQSGVIDPGAGGHLFFPGIAVNKNDAAIIGFSRSDAARYIEAAFVSRSTNDTLGAMSQITVLKTGEASYSKDFGSGDIRWGDYSATVVDPSNDTSFWTIQEYAAMPVPGGTPDDDRWGTWWGKIDVQPTYTVGGTVTGLNGTLVLQNNGGGDLTITADGQFTFAAAVNSSAYSVTVRTQPSGQTCTITNGSGTISGADITNVAVTCSDNSGGGGGSNSGGGGCTIGGSNYDDFSFPLFLLLSMLYLFKKTGRLRKKHKVFAVVKEMQKNSRP